MSLLRTAVSPKGAVAISILTSLLLLGGVATAIPATVACDDPKTSKPKASSFAPHHSKSHVYGTPIAKPILHKRKKPKKPAAAGAAPEPIK